MNPIGYIFISIIIVSLASLVGIFSFLFGRKKMSNLLMFLVSFSAGSLLGGAFIHLLPEAEGKNIGIFVIIGILAFFVLEKFIHWRHCHIPTSKEHPHPFAYMNLVGDAFHNMLDGIVIAGSYLISIPLGISTSFAILFHEIPQEMGDFGVLIHGGFSKARALMLNFLTALTALIGGAIGILFSKYVGHFSAFIIPFTAGGFIYIAGSDLIPELHKESKINKSLLQFFGIICGVIVMAVFVLME